MGVGGVVGSGVPVTSPVQAVPLSAKVPGTGLLPVLLPRNPNEALPPVATAPLYEALFACTRVPDWVRVAFQAWVTFWPAAKSKTNCQAVTASPRLVIWTSALKPPSH